MTVVPTERPTGWRVVTYCTRIPGGYTPGEPCHLGYGYVRECKEHEAPGYFASEREATIAAQMWASRLIVEKLGLGSTPGLPPAPPSREFFEGVVLGALL